MVIIAFAAALIWSVRAGARNWSRTSGEVFVARLLAVIAPVAAVVTATLVILRLLFSPLSHWNGARLAPAVALLRGYGLYYGPDDGPALNHIYPPLSALVYVPAGLMPDPASAIIAGSAIAVLLCFLPIAWILFAGARRGDPGLYPFRIVLFCVFVLMSLSVPSQGYAAFSLHCDAPALGFAVVAALGLLPAAGRTPAEPAAPILAALAGVAAVACKQTYFPALLAPALWGTAVYGGRALRPFFAAAALGLSAAGWAGSQFFGADELIFNTVSIPSHHPWQANTLEQIAGSVLTLALNCLPFAAALGILVLAPLAEMPAEGLRRRFAGRVAEHLASAPWTLFAFAAVLFLPTALISYVKVGGDVNSLSSPVHFLLAALALRLLTPVAAEPAPPDAPGESSPATPPGGNGAARELPLFRLAALVLVVGLLLSHAATLPSWLRYWHDGLDGPQTAAWRYACSHPGQAYFPHFPLANLYAEGRLDHFDYGVYDRNLAGYEVTPEHFLAHTPPRMRLVCMFGQTRLYAVQRYLGPFRRREQVPELPGWNCLVWEPQTSGGTRNAQ